MGGPGQTREGTGRRDGLGNGTGGPRTDRDGLPEIEADSQSKTPKPANWAGNRTFRIFEITCSARLWASCGACRKVVQPHAWNSRSTIKETLDHAPRTPWRGAVQFDRLKNDQAPDFVPSRLFIYYNERDIENDIAVDGGAFLRDGIKTLNQLGVCAEADWPYVPTAPLSDGGPFPAGSKPVTKPNSQAYADALQYNITSYQRLTPTLAQLQGCLAGGYPFVFGFTVYASWYDQDPRPATISLPTGEDDSQVGGHAVLCVGYDNATSLFKIRNSWGPEQATEATFTSPIPI